MRLFGYFLMVENKGVDFFAFLRCFAPEICGVLLRQKAHFFGQGKLPETGQGQDADLGEVVVTGGQNIQGNHAAGAVPPHGQRRQGIGDAAVLHIVIVPQPAGGLAAVVVVQIYQCTPLLKERPGEFPLSDQLFQRPLDLLVEVVDAPSNGRKGSISGNISRTQSFSTVALTWVAKG